MTHVGDPTVPRFRRIRRLGTLYAVPTLLILAPMPFAPAYAASRTPNPGSTCQIRQTGAVLTIRGSANDLMCLPVKDCRGASRSKWLPFPKGTAGPSQATFLKYGQCRTAVPSTTTTTIAATTPEGGEGVACLRGKWVLDAAGFKRYLVEATGISDENVMPGFVGTLELTISGGRPDGDQLTRADISANGFISGKTPDGALEARLRGLGFGRFDASSNAISFRPTDTFIVTEFIAAGQRVDIGTQEVPLAAVLWAYECSGATLTFVIDVPATEGQPARRPRMTLRRTT